MGSVQSCQDLLISTSIFCLPSPWMGFSNLSEDHRRSKIGGVGLEHSWMSFSHSPKQESYQSFSQNTGDFRSMFEPPPWMRSKEIGSPWNELPRSPFADKNADKNADLQKYQNSSDTRWHQIPLEFLWVSIHQILFQSIFGNFRCPVTVVLWSLRPGRCKVMMLPIHTGRRNVHRKEFRMGIGWVYLDWMIVMELEMDL